MKTDVFEVARFVENRKANPMHRFVCDECDQFFPATWKLKRHVDGVHLKLKPFKCEYCNKSFSMAPTLNRHISSKHKKIRHPCDFCDATFSQKGHMNLHIKKYHLERLVVEMK